MKLFIFGSTGDLVKRKVLPALQELESGELEVWALGRKDFTEEIYRDFVCRGKCSPEFRKRIFYRKIDLESKNLCEDCMGVFETEEINYFYISFPPELIRKTLESLAYLKSRGIRVRILIEKPFGRNLEEAESLERFINDNFSGGEVWLSDHYLFKENILRLKRTDFRKLKIVSLESIGLEGRSYYDSVGALRDMVQSHFLNIAFKLAGKIRPDKIKVLKFERMQYLDYAQELGKSSGTETLVKLKIKAGGKEFEFITGKAFDKKVSFMEIDKKRIDLEDKNNPYKTLFSDFLDGRMENFPEISNALLAWRIIERVESSKPKPKLELYRKGISGDELISS
ncbi:MAG: hypothetical protein KGH55_03580 [Nanoarchaeota archaeon]|nr:hypothetical protein [Nanoarchaeota archaeon]